MTSQRFVSFHMTMNYNAVLHAIFFKAIYLIIPILGINYVSGTVLNALYTFSNLIFTLKKIFYR